MPRAGVRRGPLSLTVGLSNVLDRTYHEHLSYQRDSVPLGTIVNEPGRNAFVSVAWRF